MTKTPSPARTYPPSSAAVAGSWQLMLAAWHRPTPSPLHTAVLRILGSLALVAALSAGAGCTDDGAPVAPASFDTPHSAIPSTTAETSRRWID